MSPMPFSVLMSVYAREQARYLEQSLESLTKSTVAIPELVLVEDGPLGPELEAVIDAYRRRLPIASVRLPVNGGLSAALNAGLRHCSHEYIARFDSDDLIVPTRFEQQVRYLDAHPEVGVVGSTIEEFDAESYRILGSRILPTQPAALAAFARTRSPLNHPSVMFRRSLIVSVGGYPDIRFLEDYALWVRCLTRGAAIANLPDTLVRMRAGKAQAHRRRGFMYVRSELRLAQAFRRWGFLSFAGMLRFVLLRVPPRLLPASLLQRLYARVLRRPSAAPQ